MAPAPRALSPSVLIRRKALYQGVFGSSRLWRVIAMFVFGRSIFKRLFGRNEQVLGVLKMKGPGHLVQLETYRKPTRRQRRRAGAAGSSTS